MIRPAGRADLPKIVPLWAELNQEGTRVDPRYRVRPDVEALLAAYGSEAWFERFLPFPACLVAEVDGGPVGFVACLPVPDHPILEHEPTARIDSLYVSKAYRRRGLARALVEDMLRRATAAGYARFEVNTLALDARALAFWRATGFTDLRVVLCR